MSGIVTYIILKVILLIAVINPLAFISNNMIILAISSIVVYSLLLFTKYVGHIVLDVAIIWAFIIALKTPSDIWSILMFVEFAIVILPQIYGIVKSVFTSAEKTLKKAIISVIEKNIYKYQKELNFQLKELGDCEEAYENALILYENEIVNELASSGTALDIKIKLQLSGFYSADTFVQRLYEVLYSAYTDKNIDTIGNKNIEELQSLFNEKIKISNMYVLSGNYEKYAGFMKEAMSEIEN